jgi:hypothetical protein
MIIEVAIVVAVIGISISRDLTYVVLLSQRKYGRDLSFGEGHTRNLFSRCEVTGTCILAHFRTPISRLRISVTVARLTISCPARDLRAAEGDSLEKCSRGLQG